MLTALQFSQLAAAAWAGPAASHFATISHYAAPGGYQDTQYQVSYLPFGPEGQPPVCFLQQGPCPFEVIAAAVQAFADAQPAPSLLGAMMKAHAVQALSAAAAQLAGAPLPATPRRPGLVGRCLRHRCGRLSHVQQ